VLTSMNFSDGYRQLWARYLRVADAIAPFAAEYDKTGAAPVKSLAAIKEAGLFGLGIAPGLPGSLNADVRATVLALTALATADPATALGFNMHIYAMRETHRQLTDEGRQLLASLGKDRLFSALTSEPGASSALPETFNPKLRVEETEGGFLLSGVKKFASNFEVSDYALVYAGDGQGAFMVLIVDTNQPGLSVKDIWNEAAEGMRNTRSNEVTFDKVFVPKEYLLYRGDNFLQSALYTDDRLFYYTSVYMGVAITLLHKFGYELKTRKAAGKTLPLIYLESNSIPFGKLIAQVEAAWTTLWNAATTVDEDGISPVAMESLARAKVLVGEAVAELIHQADQLVGLNGLLNPTISRFLRDGRTARIMPPSSKNCCEMLALSFLDLPPVGQKLT